MSRPRTDGALKRFADRHLIYEIEMLAWLARRLALVRAYDEIEGRGRLDKETRNAQIEAFAIHARNLLAFFAERSSYPDDALATHYVPGWTPPKLSPTLEHVASRVNKEIAHLTYTRRGIVGEARKWDYLAIARDFAPIVGRFVEQAPESRVSDRFRARALAAFGDFALGPSPDPSRPAIAAALTLLPYSGGTATSAGSR